MKILFCFLIIGSVARAESYYMEADEIVVDFHTNKMKNYDWYGKPYYTYSHSTTISIWGKIKLAGWGFSVGIPVCREKIVYYDGVILDELPIKSKKGWTIEITCFKNWQSADYQYEEVKVTVGVKKCSFVQTYGSASYFHDRFAKELSLYVPFFSNPQML